MMKVNFNSDCLDCMTKEDKNSASAKKVGLTLFRMGWAAKSSSLPFFSTVTSRKLRISPQNFLTFSFNPASTLA